jgi:hypothetical protein
VGDRFSVPHKETGGMSGGTAIRELELTSADVWKVYTERPGGSEEWTMMPPSASCSFRPG